MLLLAVAMTAAAPSAAPPERANSCPTTTSYYAYRDGKPLKPRKLTELPPATAYMAVYRHIGRCEAPMTMVEYSTQGRRH
jgi:hypothetical protein